MKPFIVISCLVLVAMAKPQGYSYSAPSAGLSASSAAALSVALLPPHSSSHFSSAPSYSHGAVSSHGSLGLSAHSSGGSLSLGSSYSVAPGSSYSSFSSAPSSSALLAPAPVLAPPAPLPAPTFVPSLPVQSSNTLIQKHIYVHVPPPEEEERAPVFQLPPQSRQKHYKIIFIKAPSTPSVSQQLIQAQLAQQQQTEEKTLVYVLVKKPESIEDIQQNIPRVPLSQPNKPEVYFIKYKAQTGLSQPVPISAPIPLSAPSFVQSSANSGAVDLGLSGLSGQQTTTTVLSHASDSSSAAVAAAAAAATSSSSVESSSSDTSSHLSSGASNADIASITTVIQPRKPAAEYGPPH